MLHDFCVSLEKHVEGVPHADGLIQKIRPHQQEFRLSIRKTAPNFRPFERRYKDERTLATSSFLCNEGEEDAGWMEEDDGIDKIASVQEVLYIDEVFQRAEQ